MWQPSGACAEFLSEERLWCAEDPRVCGGKACHQPSHPSPVRGAGAGEGDPTGTPGRRSEQSWSPGGQKLCSRHEPPPYLAAFNGALDSDCLRPPQTNQTTAGCLTTRGLPPPPAPSCKHGY